MSKEFDEFMNSMSEIPTNSSNSEKPNMCDVREDDVYEMAQEYAIKSHSPNIEARRKGFVDGYNKAKENTYTEDVIDKLLSFYTDDAPASYIKSDYKKYLKKLKQ